MPLKVPNYGEWDGERRNLSGHHPPACTCYRCNEAKMPGRENRQPPQTASSPAAAQPTAPARPSAPKPKPVGPRPARRPLRATGRVIGTALRYAAALHLVTIAGLAIYAVVQDGTAGVAPALAAAWDAYAGAWTSVIQAIRG